MRILFFSHYYTPEVNCARLPHLRALPRLGTAQGHDVTVVTCAPNHPHGAIYPGYRNRLFHSETIDAA